MYKSLCGSVFCRRIVNGWLSVTRSCSVVPATDDKIKDSHQESDREQTHPPTPTTHMPHTPPPLTTHAHSTEHIKREDQRLLKVAIVGLPNAGKSTLVNQMIGQKVFAVSPKRHTTLHRAMGVFTQGSSQVVLLDTPGLISYKEGRKLKVSKQFLTDPTRSVMEADIIVVMVDAANKYARERLDQNITRILRANSHVPSLLVLNKIDLLSHKHVLLSVAEGLTGTMERKDKLKQIADLTRKLKDKNLPDKVCTKFESIIQNLKSELETSAISCPESSVEQHHTCHVEAKIADSAYSGNVLRRELCHRWPHFKETFMVSSLTGDGVESLKSHLVGHAPKGEWQYTPCEVTDTPALDLVEDIVREKLFEYLEKEIPYVITQSNVLWESSDEGGLCIYQNINCKTDKQASIVIGPAGRTIQAITAESTEDIQRLLNTPVDLTLNVRVHKK